MLIFHADNYVIWIALKLNSKQKRKKKANEKNQLQKSTPPVSDIKSKEIFLFSSIRFKRAHAYHTHTLQLLTGLSV